MSVRSGVLIVAELEGEGLRPNSLELVTAAKILPGPVTGLVVGAGSDGMAALAASGIERILHVDRNEPAFPSAEAATTMINAAIEKVNPAIVLMPSTTLATEYAPSLAARLDVGLVSDAFELHMEEGAVTATRPALGGRLQSDVTLDAGAIQLIAVRAGAFERATAKGSPASIESLEVAFGDLDQRVRVVSVVPKERSGVGLSAANVVVAGGRGLKEAANFTLIEDLAAALGGAVGATRAVTDLGWRPHSEQIGQTGKTIAPSLYIAVGVSGAVQHTVGMTGSENIVAINRDPDAPIFKNASFGIVGDLFEVLPALTSAITAARS